MYLTLKYVHITCASLTIAGFLLRSYWMIRGSVLLRHRLTRVLPHIIDTVFLVAGIALVFETHIEIMMHGWLLAKFAGLVAYIILALIALRLGRTFQVRIIALFAAVSVYAYIVGVAFSKSVGSWFSCLAG